MAGRFASASIPRAAVSSFAATWRSARRTKRRWRRRGRGRHSGTHWLGEFGFFEALRMKGQEGPVPKTFKQMLKSGMQIVGTADEVGEEIQRLRDTLNVDYMIFIMYAGMTEHKRMIESIRLFGEKVIPKFAETKEPKLAGAEATVALGG